MTRPRSVYSVYIWASECKHAHVVLIRRMHHNLLCLGAVTCEYAFLDIGPVS